MGSWTLAISKWFCSSDLHSGSNVTFLNYVLIHSFSTQTCYSTRTTGPKEKLLLRFKQGFFRATRVEVLKKLVFFVGQVLKNNRSATKSSWKSKCSMLPVRLQPVTTNGTFIKSTSNLLNLEHVLVCHCYKHFSIWVILKKFDKTISSNYPDSQLAQTG